MWIRTSSYECVILHEQRYYGFTFRGHCWHLVHVCITFRNYYFLFLQLCTFETNCAAFAAVTTFILITYCRDHQFSKFKYIKIKIQFILLLISLMFAKTTTHFKAKILVHNLHVYQFEVEIVYTCIIWELHFTKIYTRALEFFNFKQLISMSLTWVLHLTQFISVLHIQV